MTSTAQARPRANHDDAPKTHHRGKPARHGPRPGRAANRATPPRATHRPPHTARPMVVVPMLVPKRRLARRHSSELGAGRTIWSAARRQQHTLRTAPNAARVRGRFSELSSSFCIWLTFPGKPRRPDAAFSAIRGPMRQPPSASPGCWAAGRVLRCSHDDQSPGAGRTPCGG